jgi:hypothetical protein
MLPVHTKDESLPHKREQFLTVIGRLVLQPVSFHVEKLFPAQVCVQRQTIPAAAQFSKATAGTKVSWSAVALHRFYHCLPEPKRQRAGAVQDLRRFVVDFIRVNPRPSVVETLTKQFLPPHPPF